MQSCDERFVKKKEVIWLESLIKEKVEKQQNETKGRKEITFQVAWPSEQKLAFLVH